MKTKHIYLGLNVNYNFSIYYTSTYSLNLIYHNVDFAYIENESLSCVFADKNSYSELYYNKEQGIVGYLLSDSILFNLKN
jgi:hypothetical protein